MSSVAVAVVVVRLWALPPQPSSQVWVSALVALLLLVWAQALVQWPPQRAPIEGLPGLLTAELENASRASS